MHPDVTGLQSFYSNEIGRIAGQLIGRRLRLAWPNIRGPAFRRRLCNPFLSVFGEAERLIAAMPAGQGVIPWPEGGDQ